MLLSKQIEVSVTARNINHYRANGYDVPERLGEMILINVEDLPSSSHVKILYRCDCCGKDFETEYHYWNHRKYPELGDLCKPCAAKIKLPKAMTNKYGQDNPAKVESIVERKKQTNLERYGNEWSIASDAVRENIAETMLDRYGVENAMQSEAVKQKTAETVRARYGVDFVMQNPEIRAKSIQTCLDRYGVPCSAQAEEVRAKMRKSLYRNGTTPSSKAEKAMCVLLAEIYGEEYCTPSYPFGELSMDCLLDIDGVQIDVEYDGAYWHKGRGQIDAARNAVVMDAGCKILRIKANNRDELPAKEQIQEAIDSLVKGGHHLVFIDMNK